MHDGLSQAIEFDDIPEALRRRATQASFSPGAHIFREGEAVGELYLLTSGTVDIVLGPRTVALLGPGAWVGEMAMLTGATSSTSVIARTEVAALKVTQREFVAAADEDPSIFRHLAQVLAQRLSSADRMLSERQAARIVLLWHDRRQAQQVESILAACGRWASTPPLILQYDADENANGSPLADPNVIATIDRKLAAGVPATLSIPDAADPLLSPFLGRVSQFAPLIILASSQPFSPTAMPRVTETVSLTNESGAPAVATNIIDVPHSVWRTGEIFDPGRVARGICRRRIGLALGGGASRGFAHLGVLGVLQQARVPIDVVTGTSIGAAIAASVAIGDSLDEIGASMEVSGRAATVPQLLPAHGIFSTLLLESSLKRRFRRRQFSDLTLPLGVTAVDLNTAEELVFTSGQLVPALLASMAVPGIFPPVRHEGRILVDGGLRVPVPAAACRALGADVVIASRLRVDSHPEHERERHALPLLAESFTQALEIMQDQIGLETIGLADVAIDTAVPRRLASLFDFRHRALVEAAGERSAQEALPQIFDLVQGLRAEDERAVRAAA